MAQYLDKTGLTTLWNKIKNTFALKSHTHTKSQIKDFPTIPTVNNPTITINQRGTKKGSFTLNQSGDTTIDLTDYDATYTAGAGLDLSNGVFSVKTGYTTNGKNYKVTTDNSGNLYVSVPWNNDTWRPVVDNLTTTDATKSLSANQGKVLKDLVDGKAASSHTHTSLNTAFVFNNRDMPQEATNLSTTTTAHTINFYRNALSIPYQMDNANDGGILRCRGNSESNVIFELATWDDSGDGETIQFNYYPTTSQVTPTYSVTVPKKSGTIALTSDIPTSLPASDVYAWAKASSKPSYTKSEVGLGNVDNTADANKNVNYANSAGNADTLDGNHASAFARIAADNNLMYHTDEFTFASSGFSGAIWLNYRTAGGTNGNITEYKLGNGAGGALGSIIHSGNIGSQNVNYANSAGSANSVAWGNVTGKPSTYTPSSHTHTSLKSNTDNRNSNTTPNDYNGILNIAGLKDNNKIGLDTNIYGTYSCLIGVRGWQDSSGGNAHELAFTGNGHIAHRHGSTTSWGSWNRIAHVSDIPTKLPASNISMSFSNGVLTITYN